MAITITVDPTFKKLNDDPSYSIKPGGLGREVELIVNVAITASTTYLAGGLTLDFSGTGLQLRQVYLCDVIQGHGGFVTEYVPAANNAAATGKLKFYGKNNAAIDPVAADGTITLASAQAGDTVTVNGLVYTAVSGAKADDTEFSIDTSDTAAATDLADSIDDDVRTGITKPSLDVSATSSTDTVTVVCTTTGIEGNEIDLASSNGTRLAVSAATLTGGVGNDISALDELEAGDTGVQGKTLRCAIRGVK